MPNPAAQFIEESIKHPEWLRVIEAGDAAEIVRLAGEHGFACSLDDLKQAAGELLGNQEEGQGKPDEKEVADAASGLSDLQSEMGYGDDTGYAALYGVAGVILKL